MCKVLKMSNSIHSLREPIKMPADRINLSETLFWLTQSISMFVVKWKLRTLFCFSPSSSPSLCLLLHCFYAHMWSRFHWNVSFIHAICLYQCIRVVENRNHATERTLNEHNSTVWNLSNFSSNEELQSFFACVLFWINFTITL